MVMQPDGGGSYVGDATPDPGVGWESTTVRAMPTTSGAPTPSTHTATEPTPDPGVGWESTSVRAMPTTSGGPTPSTHTATEPTPDPDVDWESTTGSTMPAETGGPTAQTGVQTPPLMQQPGDVSTVDGGAGVGGGYAPACGIGNQWGFHHVRWGGQACRDYGHIQGQ